MVAVKAKVRVKGDEESQGEEEVRSTAFKYGINSWSRDQKDFTRAPWKRKKFLKLHEIGFLGLPSAVLLP